MTRQQRQREALKRVIVDALGVRAMTIGQLATHLMVSEHRIRKLLKDGRIRRETDSSGPGRPVTRYFTC